MTFAAPLKVTLRLIVFDIDEETGAKSVKDIKEQDVYMGDMPLMTMNGTFVVNGTERVIVSQMHRSPGVFFDHDKGKTHSSGKLLFAARIIPYRGSWLDIEFDAKDIVYARIDRRRKIPVTSLLFALGLDGEEILDTFYKKIPYKRTKDGWRMPFDADAYEGLQGGRRPDRRRHRRSRARSRQEADRARGAPARREGPQGAARRRRGTDRPVYRAKIWSTRDRRNLRRSRRRDHREDAARCSNEAGYKELPMLDIDHINIGAYIRNTLAVDKNTTREEALFDIYRVMRPGEPPTVDTAAAMFQSLFFDPSATTFRRSAA